MPNVLEGFDEFTAKVLALPNEVRDEVDMEVYDAALEWAKRAKQSAPVDHGVLQNGISAVHDGMMEASIYSNAKYSPYVEWGTGTYVFYGQSWMNPDLLAYAAEYKGQGKRQINHYPQPFFFVHQEAIQQLFIERVSKNVLEREH